MRWTEMRGAARSLLRAPGFTLPTVAILALGIGATATIFAVVNGVLLAPLPWPDDDELLVLCEESPSFRDFCVGSVPTVRDVDERATTLEAAGAYRSWNWAVDDAGETVALAGGIAAPEVFPLLGARPAAGRLFAPDEIGPERDDVVVLAHSVWTQRYGGDPAVIGRTLLLDGEPVTVVGVLPEGFTLPELDWVQIWRPLHVDPDDEERRSWRGFVSVARLADGTSLERARSELAELYRSLGEGGEAIGPEWSLEARTLRDHLVGDVRRPLLAFLLAAALLLTVACANVANLLLARGVRREHEMAVRASLGAPQGRLVGTVLAESFVLTATAGVLGVGAALWGTGAFRTLAPASLPRLENVAVDGTVVAFTLLLTLGVVVAAGLLPALRIRNLDLAPTLRKARDGDAGGRGGLRTRRFLVVGELALSLALLFGTLLLVRTFEGFAGWEPGFDREGLVATSVFASSGTYPERSDVAALWARMEEEVAALPGVVSAATVSSMPLRGGRETSTYRAEGMETVPDGELPSARWYDVSPGYFEMLGVEVVEGRGLRETDEAGAPAVALVNRTLARRAWPGESAVGKWVSVPAMSETGGDRLRVVGVVADIPPVTPGATTDPEIYWSNRQFARWGTLLVFRLRPGSGEVAQQVQARVEAIDPELSVGWFRDMEASLEAALVRPRFNLWLMGAFGAVTVLLGLAGLYGVLAYEVAHRARTIGIRMALGASRRAVLRDVLTEAGVLALLGVGLGALVALAASEVTASLVHGVSATDLSTLAASGALLVLLAVLASAGPAWRASRTDPARLLRES